MIDGIPTTLKVRSAQPEEPAQDAPATPTGLDFADDLLSVHTDWGESKPNPCLEIDAFVEIITQFEATRPGVVRSIPIFVILQHSLFYARKGRLQELWYSSSEEAKVIDEFWSHSWQAPAWQKYVNLLFLNNTWPASVVGTLAAVTSFVLFLTGVLPEWAETGRTCRWCILLGTLAYYPTFLLLYCMQLLQGPKPQRVHILPPIWNSIMVVITYGPSENPSPKPPQFRRIPVEFLWHFATSLKLHSRPT
ncbi:unnamed protein product [Symbiodinium sp. CCMP2592]|nr:unnamed protein product [Symbiodinium sp. CCMP2592]